MNRMVVGRVVVPAITTLVFAVAIVQSMGFSAATLGVIALLIACAITGVLLDIFFRRALGRSKRSASRQK